MFCSEENVQEKPSTRNREGLVLTASHLKSEGFSCKKSLKKRMKNGG